MVQLMRGLDDAALRDRVAQATALYDLLQANAFVDEGDEG